MLIHTTMRVVPQLQSVQAISKFVGELRNSWAAGETEVWRQQWLVEREREPAERSGNEPIDFDDLVSVIPDVLSAVKVVADNSQSTERLIYDDEPATVIAVGGNTLSRGLTLEGLVSSFFLRSAIPAMRLPRWTCDILPCAFSVRSISKHASRSTVLSTLVHTLTISSSASASHAAPPPVEIVAVAFG